MGFLDDKKSGDQGEAYFCSLLANAGIPFVLNDASSRQKLRGWDVQFTVGDAPPFLAEVKFDKTQQRTGNIAVEWYNPSARAKSGLFATKAGVWVYVLADPMRAYAIRAEDLLGLFHARAYVRDVPNAGDGNATCRLFDDSVLDERFARLDTLSETELVNTLLELCHARENVGVSGGDGTQTDGTGRLECASVG